MSNTTNKVLRTQGNIQLRSKHNSNFDFTHAISPSATPTTTASNIELNKKIGIKNTYKFSLKSLIDPRNTNKHHIPRINGEKYTYNPNQLTNRFNSPQGRLQISTRGITNRDKHYYVLPSEPNEKSKFKMLHLTKNSNTITLNKTNNEENRISIRKNSPLKKLPRLIGYY